MGSNSRIPVNGFTFIEMSIVLIIIGLVAGGILVGQDLIAAAAVRAQISQIEKYNQAANTFRIKYGYLPGDIKDPEASNFGFIARGQYAGEGDGNGVLEGLVTADAAGNNSGAAGSTGETTVFWVDLTKAGLIEGSFTKAMSATIPASDQNSSGYLPPSKLGNNSYIYIWSMNGTNYIGISQAGGGAILYRAGSYDTYVNPPAMSLTLSLAYNIDKKIDDGLPQSGNVQVEFLKSGCFWAQQSNLGRACYDGYFSTHAIPASTTTCFDNGGVVGRVYYSLGQSNGNGLNCTLSFKAQF